MHISIFEILDFHLSYQSCRQQRCRTSMILMMTQALSRQRWTRCYVSSNQMTVATWTVIRITGSRFGKQSVDWQLTILS